MIVTRIALFAFALTSTLACETARPPPMRAKAQPKGVGVVVIDPVVKVAGGTTCPDGVTDGIGDRFKSATSGALTNGGFRVVDDAVDSKAPYRAAIEVAVEYCSDAGIISGTSVLELKQGGASVWRASATGDQARGETAASTLGELVERMLYDPAVIAALSSGAG